jgi:hypothetical protein
MGKDIENRPWIQVGVADCPTCGSVCTGHTMSTVHFGRVDWQKATLDYFCFKCKASFHIVGAQTRQWLSAVFEESEGKFRD